MSKSHILIYIILLSFSSLLFANNPPLKNTEIKNYSTIVKTGINLRKIYNIDITKKSANIDFDIWFKYKDNIDTSKFYFSNAIGKIDFKNGYKSVIDGWIYERFDIRGEFKINFNEKKFNITRELIGFELHCKMTDSGHLRFLLDKKFMAVNSLVEDIKTKSIFEDSAWNIRKAKLYVDHQKVNILGDQSLTKYDSNKFLESRLNLDIIIDNKAFDPNEVLNLKGAFFILVLSVASLIILTILKKRIYKKKFLKTVALSRSNNTLFEINDKINFDTIVEISQKLEKVLKLKDHTDSKKQYVMQIGLEMIENMLKHSLNSTDIGYGKKETKGSFTLSYDRKKEIYTLKSCNIIDEQAKYTIQESMNTLKNLDDKELRKLSRQKLRDNGVEDSSVGLGFILMIRRAAKPVTLKFEDINDSVIKFNLEVKI